MAIEIRVPALGESISEATVGKWFKKAGEPVRADEPLVELETDKVTLEVNAPGAGVLSEITAETGQTVAIGALLGQLSARSGGAGCGACSGCGDEGRSRTGRGNAAGAVRGQNRGGEAESISPRSPAAGSAARR